MSNNHWQFSPWVFYCAEGDRMCPSNTDRARDKVGRVFRSWGGGDGWKPCRERTGADALVKAGVRNLWLQWSRTQLQKEGLSQWDWSRAQALGSSSRQQASFKRVLVLNRIHFFFFYIHICKLYIVVVTFGDKDLRELSPFRCIPFSCYWTLYDKCGLFL